MSFYFAIIGTKDNPLFEFEFGTSKAGGDGVSRFREEQRHMNQFIVHSSLDIVEEVQWGTGSMYLKHIDHYKSSHVWAYLTGGNIKFLLLSCPETHVPPPTLPATSRSSAAQSARSSTYTGGAGYSSYASPTSGVAGTAASNYNPSSPAVEEATKNFFLEVYDAWVKTIMNPFYQVNMPVRSPVFRAKVAAAGKKYL
ncbi:trafficking protein-like protein particle complex subunit 2 [Venturia nashicola]|uniref:Trafficking protein-like protein particle complex subunit 2 n=1 Tax=Venturia nashicola TaxID=86259 RepID=A0A4Z1NHD4_9PEZI|nr:trafficking protein-like protein particle complex subunit 2 [Venturia nashicola]TLD15360.1 trafficking protein-like protein particle complex subunit 2 [Venturia nashicola]